MLLLPSTAHVQSPRWGVCRLLESYMRTFAQERRRRGSLLRFVVLAGGYLCALAIHVSSL